MADVNAVKNGMQLTCSEFETHQHPVLKEFIEGAQDRVNKVKTCLFYDLEYCYTQPCPQQW